MGKNTMATNEKPLGVFAKCLSLLIKQHEPSHTVFERIKDGFILFERFLNERSSGDGLVAQTGSSFDDLHLCRLFEESNGRHKFFPPIDFDFMLLYMRYDISDRTDLSLEGLDYHELARTPDIFALMVPSKFPGYVKLLVSVDGRTKLRDRGNSCDFHKYITPEGFLPNNVFRSKVIQDEDDDVEVLYKRQTYVASGPAVSIIDNEADGYTYDFVQSFPCKTWPHIALNWTKRHKPGGWPNQELIQEIIKDGCAVVPVGHHQSEESILEWRVSFNAAERKLSKSMLPNQKTCYSLVKLLLKANLPSSCILTSYHVKNVMFWFCEQMYGPQEWGDDALGERIIQLLDYIIKALEHLCIVVISCLQTI